MKTKFKGSPGPWQQDKDVCGFISDSKGRFLFESLLDSEDWHEHEHNIRLVALAPEMLEVLQELIAAWESGLVKSIPAMNQESAYRKAKEVIKKALGERG